MCVRTDLLAGTRRTLNQCEAKGILVGNSAYGSSAKVLDSYVCESHYGYKKCFLEEQINVRIRCNHKQPEVLQSQIFCFWYAEGIRTSGQDIAGNRYFRKMFEHSCKE